MKLLLDTHALYWWLTEQERLSPNALAAINPKSNEVYVSIASAWEMAIKVGLGKWPEAKPLIENFEQEIEAAQFRLLPIGLSHVRAAGFSLLPHRDPFDRLLLAQASIEGLSLISSDAHFNGLGSVVIW